MKRNWKNNFNLIREIINEWDPIGDTPEDEYDDLVFGIQSRIMNNESDNEILSYIFQFLNEYVGIEIQKDEISPILKKIRLITV